jgi:membrane-bound serine protease (ClpP class)
VTQLQSLRRLVAVGAVLAATALLGADHTSPPARSPAPSTAPAAGNGAGQRVLIIKVDLAVGRPMTAFIHRALRRHAANVDAVILELDTPGGDTLNMARIGEELGQVGVPVYTYIGGGAWGGALSAGAFISFSTDAIYMRAGTSIGAAAPIFGTPQANKQIDERVQEKYRSRLRAEFRSAAQKNGYPPAIAESMVDQDIEVHKVTVGEEIRYVKQRELEKLKADPLTSDRLKVLDLVSAEGELLTLTSNEAVRFDVARKTVESREELLRELGLGDAQIVLMEPGWSDRTIGLLSSPQIAFLLVLIGFGGVWLELKIPGFGWPGTIAVLAFLLVFGSQFLMGNANALEILLFLIGVALLAIEIFVTPGFGVMGGGGILCLILSLVLAMQPFVVPSAPWEYTTLRNGVLATAGGLLGSMVIALLAAWLLPHTPLFSRLALTHVQTVDSGYTSPAQPGGDTGLLGREGVVLTALRPAGKVEIDGEAYDVLSQGGFVDAGTRTRVIDARGGRVVVEPIEESDETG